MLTNAIQESGYAHQVAEHVRQLQAPGLEIKPVTLAGFHLLTVCGSPAPYVWLTPEPRGDADDMIGMWEAYVDNPVALRRRGQNLVTPILKDRLMLSAYGARTFFGTSPENGKWAVPAAKLIAMAQHFEGQGELSVTFKEARFFQNSRIESATLHLKNYVLSVGPKGMWSNTASRYLNQGVIGNDFTINDLCIRPLVTTHPLACALAACEEVPDPARHALNVALRGLQLGMLSASEIRVVPGLIRSDAISRQIHDAMNVLDRGGNGVLKALYDALVPGVISSRDFAVQFGNPFKGFKAARPSTVRRWREQVSGLQP